MKAAAGTFLLASALYVFGLLLAWATEHPAVVLALSFAATLAAALRFRHLYLTALTEQQEGPQHG